MLKKVSKCFFQNRASSIWVLIFLGTFVWSLTMVRSGLCFPNDCSYGIGFWGANAHDGIWHLSLINRLSKFNFSLPILSGARMINYHFGFDFLVALIHRITGISASKLYFQITPPILAFLLGFMIYKVSYLWRKSLEVSFWTLFLVYFGGNFAYLVSLFRGEGLSGESMFWIQPSTFTLINPPFALSLIVLLLSLFCLEKYYRFNKLKYLLLSSFLFGSLAQIKAYASLLAIFFLFLLSISEIIFLKEKKIFKVFLMSFLISLSLSFPFLRGKSIFSFNLFWFLETMFAFPDRLYWPKMHQAMVTYRASLNLLKGIPAYIFAFLVFVLGNLGIRAILFFDIKGFKKFLIEPDWLTSFFLLFLFSGFVISNLVVQEGTPWNTIQFSYYSVFFASFLAADALTKLKINKLFLLFWVLFLVIPATFSSLKHYLAIKPQAILPYEEFLALNFLKSKDDGTILFAFSYDPNDPKPQAPVPLYLYDSTAYISAYSGKDVYLEDIGNLRILGYGKEENERSSKLKVFLFNPNSISGRDFLKNNNIRYVYKIKSSSVPDLDESFLDLSKIFENSSVLIYQAN